LNVSNQLNIQVTVFAYPTGSTDYGAIAYYSQTGLLLGGNSTGTIVVAPNGNVDLSPLPSGHQKETDIVLSLVGACLKPDGTFAPISWCQTMDQNSRSSAVFIADANGNPTTQITAGWNDSAQTQIKLDDQDNDSNSYSFKPAIVLPWNNNYFISLDPVIKNGRPG
jgi:hypothetical protein